MVIRINITKNTVQRIEQWKGLYEELLKNQSFFLELNVVENRGGNGIEEMSSSLVSVNDDEYVLVMSHTATGKTDETGMNVS